MGGGIDVQIINAQNWGRQGNCSNFCKNNLTHALNVTLLMHARQQVTKAIGVFCCSSKSFYYIVTSKKVEVAHF